MTQGEVKKGKERLSCAPDEITALVKEGKASAVDRIAQCYMGHLLAVGHCACRSSEDVPDAIQDALLAVTEKLAQYRGEGSIKSWVSTMVVNACRCHGRGRKNDPSWNFPMDAASELPAHSQSPNESLARRELLAEVGRSLEALSSQDQELFLMSQVHELSAPEIARVLGRSPNAIRAQLSRIRRKMRADLATTWERWQSGESP